MKSIITRAVFAVDWKTSEACLRQVYSGLFARGGGVLRSSPTDLNELPPSADQAIAGVGKDPHTTVNAFVYCAVGNYELHIDRVCVC